MNKSSGNMYSYIDMPYNPIKGECENNCSYCYMKSIRRRFHQDPTLRLDEKSLKQGLGSGKVIFVGSSTDVFATNVPSEWITRVLNHLAEYPSNVYQLQSKNPVHFLEFLSHPLFQDPRRDIFCTTLESDTISFQIVRLPPCKSV